MNEIYSYKTVFVQNIPRTCSNDQLNEVFSVVGPIKECFVVKPNTTSSNEDVKKRLFGFVTYHSHDDCKSAVNASPSTFNLDGVQPKVTLAKKKRFSKSLNYKEKRKDYIKTIKEKKALKEKEVKVEESSNDPGFEVVPVKKFDKIPEVAGENVTKNAAKSKTAASPSTVVITGFPSSYAIADFVNLWKVKGLTIPEEFVIIPSKDSSTNQNVAHIVMKNKQAALKIVFHLNGVTFGDVTFKATLMFDPNSKDFRKAAKKSRLIVRNLHFDCTKEDLHNVFDRYGNVTNVELPQKKDGTKLGYAFVQLSHVFEAMKAIKEINMSNIKGRKVAVDWAFAREKYIKISQPISSTETKETSDQDSDEEHGGDTDTSDNSGEEDSFEIEDDIDSEPVKDDDDDNAISDDDSSSTESIEDDVGSDTNNEYEKELNKAEKSLKEDKSKKRKVSSDVHEGKTVFLRNLSFDLGEEELADTVKRFGEIKYCKVVQNPETGFSKGCAFVQFLTKDAADECVTSLEREATRVSLHGRTIFASIAQSRENIKTVLKEKKEAKQKKGEKRHLYLANEGLIRPGTQAAKGLSEIELKKRQKIEEAKRAKLKNPSVFVSTTRLCIHNLPRHVDDAELKKLFLKCFDGEKGVRITEARIMRDMQNVNEAGKARSRGYAFVNFAKHEHAIRALRSVNNNPAIFGDSKRPIVEFSLENKKALELQMQRRKRQLAKNKLKQTMAPTAVSEKKAPTMNRKEKRIQRLREQRKLNRETSLLGAIDSNVPASRLTAQVVKSTMKEDRKEFEGSSCITSSGKKVKMSKHLGPKMRRRSKGKILEQLRESKKLNKKGNPKSNQKEKRTLSKEPRPLAINVPTENRKFDSRKRRVNADLRQDKEFNELLSKYTKKFRSDSNVKQQKWFDS